MATEFLHAAQQAVQTTDPYCSTTSILTTILQYGFAASGIVESTQLDAIEIKESDRPDLCQFQCNNALMLAKVAKQSPAAIAHNVVATIQRQPELAAIFADLSVAGPGFINLSLSDAFLLERLNSHSHLSHLNCPVATSQAPIVIDFASPNVAKSMHVGHLRSSIIGDCLCRLGRFLGYQIIGDNHLGDWGTQMGMLICGLQEQMPDAVYFQADYQGEYPEESPVTIADLEQLYPLMSQRCKEDPALQTRAKDATAELHNGRRGYVALWRHFVKVSVAALQQDFAALNVHFDTWNGESSAEPLIPDMLAEIQATGITAMQDGALIIPMPPSDNAEANSPLVLLKSNGSSTYATTDLATIVYRTRKLQAQEIYYIVDQRQSLHFQHVFFAAQQSKLVPTTVTMEHVGFGTINGTDGKPFKTRAGGTVKLAELISMVKQVTSSKISELDQENHYTTAEKQEIIDYVSVATIRFADLINYRLTNYVFDIERFSQFEGKTGPYLQYSIVRMRSLLHKITAEVNPQLQQITSIHTEAERKLVLLLLKFAATLQETWQKKAPNLMCEYAFNLAQTFSKFYQSCSLLKETDPQIRQSRYNLVKVTEQALQLLLETMGIQIPSRM